VGIGVVVLHESHILTHPALAMVALLSVGVMATSLIWQLRSLLAARRLSGIAPP